MLTPTFIIIITLGIEKLSEFPIFIQILYLQHLVAEMMIS